MKYASYTSYEYIQNKICYFPNTLFDTVLFNQTIYGSACVNADIESADGKR